MYGRRWKRGNTLLMALTAALTISTGVHAQEGKNPVVLTLQEAIRAAVKRSPEVKQAQFEVEAILGKQEQADAARYPQINTLGALGPSPRARGNQVESPDSASSPVINNVFLRGDFTLIQPIYTFGLISNLREAARRGVRATEAGVDVKASEIVVRVKQAYYGLLLFKDLERLVLEIKDQLDRTIAQVERLLEIGAPGGDEVNLYKLRTYAGEVEKNRATVEKGIALAKEALRVWTGQPEGAEVEAAEAHLVFDNQEFAPVGGYVREAQARRPEFVQLREGIRAKEALVESERAKRYPQLFLGILGSFAYADNRDRLTNPFISDPLRHTFVAPILGLNWNLDFGITDGRIREAEAEVGKLRALQAFAEEGIPLQVQKAYGELMEARRQVKVLDQAFGDAKKWVVVTDANFDLGIGEAKDLADAVVGYATTRASYLQALFNYKMGIANLYHATGRDLEEAR